MVTALLAVVGIVAHGRPLGTHRGRGSGLPNAFWDYVFTTFVVFELLLVVIALVALFLFRRDPDQRSPYQTKTVRTLAILITGAALLAYIGHHLDLHRLLHPGKSRTTPPPAQRGAKGGKHHRATTPASHVHFRWDELAIVLGLLLGLGV
ncbi:MAG TPA: hypothetical protein VJ814_11615, partial [Gaiellaceae bacterium]|nr:hypothetical protein [Gaiellaceae bacterium]